MDTSTEGIYRQLSKIMGEASSLIRFASFSFRKHEQCPFCHLNLEEYVNSIPKDKYVTVDVPSDLLVAEKVIGHAKLVELINEVNKTGKVKFKVPKRK